MNLTADKLREGIMSLAHIPTTRLLIEARAATGELKDMMAMALQWGNEFNKGVE